MTQSKYASRGHTTHGLSKLPNGKQSLLHKVWCEMRQRCGNPNSKQYGDYGGRGIKVCVAWDDYSAFYKWSMKEGYKHGLTIERKNNDGNYEPSNCTWIPNSQQRRNNRRVIKITHNGKTQILSDWAKEIGIKYSTLYARIKKNIPINEAFKKEDCHG